MTRRLFLSLCLVFSTLAPASAAEESAPVQVELILDASASMWNKLDDGRYRIDAAKAVLADFISRAPENPNLNVGLRIYGSEVPFSKPGACEDSRLFIPIQGFDRPGLLKTVREAKAIGCTPIAKSLELALADFAEGGRRQIILCTDGEESCGGDVKAAVAALKGAGVETDLRIIGIGLSPEAVARFKELAPVENAASAKELAAALGNAVETTAAPAPASKPVAAKNPVATVALVKDGAPFAASGVKVSLVNGLTAAEIPLASQGEGKFAAPVPQGSYRAKVVDAAHPEGRLFPDLTVSEASESNEFSVDLTEGPKVTLTPKANSAVAGSTLSVKFSNALGVDGQYVVVAPVGAEESVELTWVGAEGQSGEVEVNVPDQPGSYEVRFRTPQTDGSGTWTSQAAPFAATKAAAKLTFPPTAPAGSPFKVQWDGPANNGDFVCISAAGQPGYLTWKYAAKDAEERVLTFDAPDKPGSYEVRYATGQTESVLLALPFAVTAVEASVQAPPSVSAGAKFKVEWTGPANGNDYISIAETGSEDNAYTNYTYAKKDDDGKNVPAEIQAPDKPGKNYEIRYITGQSGRKIASAPIEVTSVSATLAAPPSAVAGSKLKVQWTGPASDGDIIAIFRIIRDDEVEQKTYETPAKEDGQPVPVKLLLPDRPGKHEIRYVTGQSQKVLATVPLDITAATATVSGPATVKAGETYKAKWAGPANDGDLVALCKAEKEDENDYESSYDSARPDAETDTLKFPAPATPGKYELRYLTGQTGRILARQPVEVTP